MKIQLESLTIDQLKEIITDLKGGIKGMKKLLSLVVFAEPDGSSSNSFDTYIELMETYIEKCQIEFKKRGS